MPFPLVSGVAPYGLLPPNLVPFHLWMRTARSAESYLHTS
jgi:hypothetical protein